MKYLLPLLGLAILLSPSCRHRPDFEAEQRAIMALHNAQRQAHFEKNVALLFGDSLADYTEVNRGFVKKPTFTERKARFQAYFDAVDFIKWDDVSAPEFSFSEDATMATTVVDKEVITRNKLEGHRLDTARYTWIAVYKKHHGTWRLHQMASTSR